MLASIYSRASSCLAAGGVVLYFIGAIVSHLRVGDRAGTRGAFIMLGVGLVILVLAPRGAVS